MNRSKPRESKTWIGGVLVSHRIDGTEALPSIPTMANNAVVAAGRIILHGIKKVSDEEKARRLAICQKCEFLIRRSGSDRCAKCGCFLNFKSRLEAWHCPIKKW